MGAIAGERGLVRAALGVLALVTAILLAPADAVAEDRIEVKPESFVSGFRLKGSNGYRLSVVARGHQHITVTASNGLSQATYTTRGHASSAGIEADFGALGQIAVRFDRAAKQPQSYRGPRSPAPCRGRPAILQWGAFHGNIRFAGENGFTEVDTRRARGAFLHTFRRVCRRPSREPHAKPPRKPQLGRVPIQSDILVVKSQLSGAHPELFIATTALNLGRDKEDSLAIAFIGASLRERVGPVSIARETFTIGDGPALRVSEAGTYPVVATVKLPKPFTGSATYRKDRGLPPSWTGTLSVSLPGAGSVPLTGEGFEPGLCRATNIKALEACTRKLATNSAQALALRAAQGSGSQSQAFWDVRLSWSR